ncbi:TPA: spermidine/putrescine ABC transporter substrate-binding protein PotF, partial [Pseudomonas aeruginosa]
MRRLGLVIGFTASFAASVGTAIAGPEQVRVYNWSDLIGEHTVKDFQDKTGIEVQYDTFDSESTLQVKLLTGNSGYDVAVPSNTSLSQLIKA